MVDCKENYKFELGVKALKENWDKSWLYRFPFITNALKGGLFLYTLGSHIDKDGIQTVVLVAMNHHGWKRSKFLRIQMFL